MRQLLVLTSLMLVLAGIALPSAASASHGCRSSTSSNATLLDQTRHGVVFIKRGKSGAYGCLFSVGTVRRLRVDDDSVFSERIVKLDGRYVAYETSLVTDDTRGFPASVNVFDLRTNQLHSRFEAHTGSTSAGSAVSSLVLKKNGSVAWIASVAHEAGVPPQLHRAETGGERQQLDSGALAEGSLALSADHKTIYWTKDGEPRLAPLR